MKTRQCLICDKAQDFSHTMTGDFNYSTFSTDADVERLLLRYAKSRRPITVDFRKLVHCLRCVDRATHLIHPYPAKLLAHIPFFSLANRIFSNPGDTVLDPFCGSGTVLLESQLAGRTAFGVDSSPLARLVTRVKTTPISSQVLKRAIRALYDRIQDSPRGSPPDVINLQHWFYPHVTKQLLCLLEAIIPTRNSTVRDFFLVCFSSCVRKVSLADPRLSVPVRLRSGQYPEGHFLREKTDQHLRRLRRVNVRRVFERVVAANCDRMAKIDVRQHELPSAGIVACDARALGDGSGDKKGMANGLRDESIRLIVTSPPYPGAQKYIRSVSLSLGWLGMCTADELLPLKRRTIGREEYSKAECERAVQTGILPADRLLREIHRKNPRRATIAGTYLLEMRDALRQMYQVIKPGGHLVLVAANNKVCHTEFKTQEYLRRLAEEVGFATKLRLIDDIRSRGLMTKRNSTADMITREWVLVFEKEK